MTNAWWRTPGYGDEATMLPGGAFDVAELTPLPFLPPSMLPPGPPLPGAARSTGGGGGAAAAGLAAGTSVAIENTPENANGAGSREGISRKQRRCRPAGMSRSVRYTVLR